MDCIIYFRDPASNRYKTEVSLGDTVQKGLDSVIRENNLADESYNISTSKGKRINIHQTFADQKIRAGSELVLERRGLANPKVRMYSIGGGGVILFLLAVIIALVTYKPEPAAVELEQKKGSLTDSPAETNISETVSKDHATIDARLQKLQQEIDFLTSPSLGYAARKEKKDAIIYTYFSGPNAAVVEKSHGISTNATTINECLSALIVLDNALTRIVSDGIEFQNDKITTIVIEK